MKRLFIVSSTLLTLVLTTAYAQTPTLNDVTNNGNFTGNVIQVRGSQNLPTSSHGVELFYHEGLNMGFLQAYDRDANQLRPLALQGSSILANGRTLINGATDDGFTSLQVEGAARTISMEATDGMVAPDTKYYAPLGVTRAASSDNLAYYALTKYGTWIGAIGLDGNNSMIFGSTSPGLIEQGNRKMVSYMAITAAGNVGIGTSNPQSALSVKGTIMAQKMKISINTTDWPDFVFDHNYYLPSLQELEAYINAHQHLPGVPSAAEVAKDGQDLGELNKVLLQKVEELTLQLIKLQKQVDALQVKTSK